MISFTFRASVPGFAWNISPFLNTALSGKLTLIFSAKHEPLIITCMPIVCVWPLIVRTNGVHSRLGIVNEKFASRLQIKRIIRIVLPHHLNWCQLKPKYMVILLSISHVLNSGNNGKSFRL